jgi:hypothetical protein
VEKHGTSHELSPHFGGSTSTCALFREGFAVRKITLEKAAELLAEIIGAGAADLYFNEKRERNTPD